MIEADNAEVDEYTLVFSRMTFTGERLVTTSVYLDADDGELVTRTTDSRYFTSDGQIIVRDIGSTAVLDVGRTLDGLVVRDVETGVTLRLRESDPAAALDPALVGHWTGTGDGHTWSLRFDAVGEVAVRQDDDRDDDIESYTVAGAYLLIDDDAYSFSVLGDRLTLFREDQEITLTRADAAASLTD